MPIRAAFVSTIFHYPWGGADKLWTRTAELLTAQSHKILISVAPQTAACPRIRKMVSDGTIVHQRQRPTSEFGLRERALNIIQHWLRHPDSTTARLNAFAPDFVFICQGGTFDFLAEPGLLRWLQRTKTRFSLICQSNDDRRSLSSEEQQNARSVLLAADSVFFVSTHNRNLAFKQVGGTYGRSIIVQNPVELDFQPMRWPTQSIPRFAMVARLENSHKGLDLALKSLARVFDPQIAWEIWIVGRGPDEEALRRLAEELNISSHVHFKGFMDRPETIWDSCHWLLLPSLVEGCSLAMLEALKRGRPVLATDVGGARDWIRPGLNGTIAKFGDWEDFASKLKEVWDSQVSWPAMGEAAYQTATQMDSKPEQVLLANCRISLPPK